MNIYKILWTSLSSDIMQTCHTEKNTDQQSFVSKRVASQCKTRERSTGTDKNAIATTARERANLKA